MILRKIVFINFKLYWCLANILLHRQLFETCVETLLNTMFIFDESPPGLEMRKHLCFCFCFCYSNFGFLFYDTVQLQCLWRASGRRVTRQNKLFHTSRCGRDWRSNPVHPNGTQTSYRLGLFATFEALFVDPGECDVEQVEKDDGRPEDEELPYHSDLVRMTKVVFSRCPTIFYLTHTHTRCLSLSLPFSLSFVLLLSLFLSLSLSLSRLV
jgi:hypothetical protein